MNEEQNKNGKLKGIVVAIICAVLVLGCVGFGVYYIGSRKYDTVEAETTTSAADIDSTQPTGNLGDIRISSGESLPDELSAIKFVKRGYELSELMAVESFTKTDDISVNKLVQYAFCYLYAGNGCLVDNSSEKMKYRSATDEQLKMKITELFGSAPKDITSSNLYNSGNKVYEMWEPNYKRDVLADAAVTKVSDKEYSISATYYNDDTRTDVLGSKTIVVKDDGNGFYMSSMK